MRHLLHASYQKKIKSEPWVSPVLLQTTASAEIISDTQAVRILLSTSPSNQTIVLFLQKKAGKITEINHIDKPDKLHLAGRVNRELGHAVWSEAERRTEPSG